MGTMEMQFFGGQGRRFKSVNYMICKDGDVSIYAEVEVPEGASDDYGYLTMKHELIRRLPADVVKNIVWFYDNDSCLEEDAKADCEVFVDMDL